MTDPATPAAPPPAQTPPAPPAAPPGPLALASLAARIAVEVPGTADMVAVEGPALIVDRRVLVEVMRFLRNDRALRLDFLSNLCAVDWLKPNALLEVVYHLFSVALRHGPLTVKCRTANRTDDAIVPSVTPLWRSAEFQEREAFDLYGVIFVGHPDLRRILTWDEMVDFPMRKDYRPPDNFEWEPTPHDEVLKRAALHEAERREKAGQ